MTAKDLKNALLQEAVQGKLTEGWRNKMLSHAELDSASPEYNAKALLEQIKKERGESLPLATERKRSSATPSAGSNAARNACSSHSELSNRHPELVSGSIPEKEILFDIPESWCWCRLGDVTSKLTDGSHNPPPPKMSGYPVISAMNIKNGKIIFDNVNRYTDQIGFDKENPRTNISNGDIIMGIIGGSIGNIAIYNSDKKVIAQRSIAIINTSISNNYISLLLQSPYIQLQLQNSKGTAQGGVYLGSLKNLLIPLPPLAEQKRIVEAIEKFMPLIEEYGKKEAVLKELNANIGILTKKAILQEAVQGKLTEGWRNKMLSHAELDSASPEYNAKALLEQIKAEKAKLIKEGKIKKEKPLPEITEDEIPFDIPERWCWCRLGELGDWRSGSTPSRTKPELYNGNIPWLKTGDLNNGYISEVPEYVSDLALETCSMRLNPIGSVLIAMYGATIGKVGILNIPATTNQACCACICSSGLHNKFLFYFLMSQKSAFEEKAEGGAQPNISREKIVNYMFPLPPLAEQKRIVAAIEQLLPLCEELGK